jgi:hypothetical protein
VFGNVGTLIAFRVGAADAEVLEKEFFPVFICNFCLQRISIGTRSDAVACD